MILDTQKSDLNDTDQSDCSSDHEFRGAEEHEHQQLEIYRCDSQGLKNRYPAIQS